ncbi:hypothetical protein CHS0354_013843 [Potamilus streckersoni]|uniref:SEFIR domain-containing protein n=2 Tax=Potamilus streckersoni TaxID=2493646 RepID=A0AAE0SJA9_9BIVA|nr:hypothetical protein CHS0354_013843 [Potamilus streckersoni]
MHLNQGLLIQRDRAAEFRQAKHGRNTLKLLYEDYMQKLDSTVNEVIEALKDIDRPDAVKVLQEAMPEIERRYREDTSRYRPGDPREGSDMESLPSTPYPYPSYHMSQQSGPSKSTKENPSYSQNFSHHGDKIMNGNMGNPSKPYRRLNSSGPYNANIGVHTSEHYGGQNINIPTSHSHVHPTYSRALSCGQVMDSHRKQPKSDSMIVHHTIGNHTTQFYHESMDHSPSIQEDPIPGPLGLVRAQQFAQHSQVYQSLLRKLDQEDMAIDSGEITVSESQDMHHGSTVYHRQLSEENNYCQPLVDPMKHGLTLNIPAAVQRSQARKIGENDIFYSPGPTPTTPVSPMVKLEEMAKDNRFRPDRDYELLMQEKIKQELIQRKIPIGHLDERNKNGCSNDVFRNIPEKVAKTKAEDSGVKSKGISDKEPPNTFPRIKASCSSSSSLTTSKSSSSGSSQNTLTKSISMPGDMKPAEYRKAFRHIKVFVTYAMDTTRHVQRVLNLCKCLEKNGFTCCVDMYRRKLNVEDRATWHVKRFREADFILICISKKYKEEMDAWDPEDSDGADADMEEENDNLNQLNTKYIYKEMYEEYLRNNNHSNRFIPLLFDGVVVDDIPVWMQDMLRYEWPKQYKDLFWMLTKPEERVRQRVASAARTQDQIAEPESLFKFNVKSE